MPKKRFIALALLTLFLILANTAYRAGGTLGLWWIATFEEAG